MMHRGSPALSVTMAVYNGAPYLRAALESLSAQTFRDFELIVVDDGSTDGTPGILAAHAEADPRLRIIRQPENLGLVPTRNRAIAECRAPLIAIADADDVFKPTRLERQVAFMAEHPHIGFCGTAVELIDSEGRQTRTYQPPQTDGDIRFFSMVGGCFWNTSTMYRAPLVRQVGGYDLAFNRGAEDYDLWVRLMAVTECANLPELLACQRVHSSSVTADLSPTFHNQSLVARRLLSMYLGRDVDERQARAALVLYQYGWRTSISSEEIDAALALLSELAAAARGRETPERLTTFRRAVARALFQQATVQLSRNRAIGMRLVRLARGWDRLAVPAAALVGYAARALAPGPVLTALRAIRNHVQPRPH